MEVSFWAEFRAQSEACPSRLRPRIPAPHEDCAVLQRWVCLDFEDEDDDEDDSGEGDLGCRYAALCISWFLLNRDGLDRFCWG